jgi:hypothetical protein
MSEEVLDPEYEPTSIDECVVIYNKYVNVIFDDIMEQTPTVQLFKSLVGAMNWKDPTWSINNHSQFIHNNMEIFASNDMKVIVNFIISHDFKEQKEDWVKYLGISYETGDSMIECIKKDIVSAFRDYPEWSSGITRGLFVTYITYLQFIQTTET